MKKIDQIFKISWYIAAIVCTIYAAKLMWNTTEKYNVIIFSLTTVLGYICVRVFVDRSPILSNVLGISANVGEIYAHYSYGNLGLVFGTIYYLSTHVIALFSWTNKKNQDEEGKIKISKISIKAISGTLIFCLLGIFIMYFFGDFILGSEKSVSNPYIFLLNVFAFVIGVSAQLTMIMRQSFSWILWSISNLLWLAINIISENYIFAVQSILYEINAIVGFYKWYQASKK